MRRAVTTRIVRAAILSAGITLIGVMPRAAWAENLADALVGAYNTSGLLEQNRALLRAADEDVATAISTLRPVIDFVATATNTITRTPTTLSTGTSPLAARLEATWLLYDGGGRNLSAQAAKETVLATRQALISVEQVILQRAVEAYMDVVLQTENVSLRENNVRVLGEEQRAAEDRFEVGEVTRTDVALAESRVAGARSNLAAARGALVTAKAEYVNAVGREPGNLVQQPPLPDRPASIAVAQSIGVRNHPDVLEAQRLVQATELTVLEAKKLRGPRLSVTASAGLSQDLDADDYSGDASVGLQFSQRLYQGGGRSSAVRSAMASRDSARANLLNVQKNVRQAVSVAFVRLEVARASIVASAEQVRAADVAFKGIREEATLGARTTLDVLSAEQELLDALTLQISAKTELSVAAYQLLAAQGALTAERLGLAVQIYDPTIYYNLAKDAPILSSKQGKDLDRVLDALGKR